MRELESYAIQAGLSLTDAQIEKFALYEALLLEWNQKMNLTSITEPAEVKKKALYRLSSGTSEGLDPGGRSLDRRGVGGWLSRYSDCDRKARSIDYFRG